MTILDIHGLYFLNIKMKHIMNSLYFVKGYKIKNLLLLLLLEVTMEENLKMINSKTFVKKMV